MAPVWRGAGLGVLPVALLLWQPKLKLCIQAPFVLLGELEEGWVKVPWMSGRTLLHRHLDLLCKKELPTSQQCVPK